MKRLDFRTAFVVLLAAAVGCKGDPTADLRTGASSLSLNPDLMFIGRGTQEPFSVVIRDQQLNPVAGPMTVTSTDPAVLTVEVDSSVPSATGANHEFIVTGVELGVAKLVATSGGVSDTADVTVLPLAFAGAVSSTTPRGGDTLTINSTSQLKFDVATAAVRIGTNTATMITKTVDQLKVLVPFGPPNPATITGVVVTYAPGVIVSLPTADRITQTGDVWAPGDTGYASAPTMPLPTATGQSVQYITLIPSIDNDANCGEGTASGGVGKCTIFKYTANGIDSLTFQVNWTPATNTTTGLSDIDIYSCNSTGVAGCFEGGAAGAAGATAATPQAFTIKPTAGVHYLVIEQYSPGSNANMYVTITKRN